MVLHKIQFIYVGYKSCLKTLGINLAVITSLIKVKKAQNFI